MAKNMVGWFEIPVENMERAMKFYETVFAVELTRIPMGPLDMAMFPSEEDGIGSAGTLVCHKEFYKPSQEGVLIYFTSMKGDVNIELNRVEKAGGKIIVPRTLIAEDVGYMGLFTDTEGNRIAVHSRT